MHRQIWPNILGAASIWPHYTQQVIYVAADDLWGRITHYTHAATSRSVSTQNQAACVYVQRNKKKIDRQTKTILATDKARLTATQLESGPIMSL